MPTKITLLSPGSSQPLMVETLFWDTLWTGPSVQQKYSKLCGYDGTDLEDEPVFLSIMQMWGWNQPLDSVQWHSSEVCPFPRYGPGGGSLLHFPCSCRQQQRHEPTIQSVWASGCHGSGWPCTNERYCTHPLCECGPQEDELSAHGDPQTNKLTDCFIYCLINSRHFPPSLSSKTLKI